MPGHLTPQAKVLTRAELSALAMRATPPPTSLGWPLQTLFTGAPLHVAVGHEGRRRTLRFNPDPYPRPQPSPSLAIP